MFVYVSVAKDPLAQSLGGSKKGRPYFLAAFEVAGIISWPDLIFKLVMIAAGIARHKNLPIVAVGIALLISNYPDQLRYMV
jgi:hypothetical protein